MSIKIEQNKIEEEKSHRQEETRVRIRQGRQNEPEGRRSQRFEEMV